MMILLNELDLLDKTDIFASDLNPDVLKISREGIFEFFYNKEYLSTFDKVVNHNLSENKISYEKYFRIDATKDQIIMNDFLREKPVYKKTDLVRDENPFKQKFDIIVCRNVIIYFNEELQNRVFKILYHNLNEKGILVVGLYENITTVSESLFQKKGEMCYRKK